MIFRLSEIHLASSGEELKQVPMPSSYVKIPIVEQWLSQPIDWSQLPNCNTWGSPNGLPVNN